MLETIEKTLWARERDLWTGAIECCAERIAPFCLMAFPGAGILRGKEIIEGLKSAPRWYAVKMSGQKVSEHHGAAVLAYRAEARRPRDDEPYNCLCTSCWVVRRGSWQMIQHHQTPEAMLAEMPAPDMLAGLGAAMAASA
ncbi:nuclear transport factor 2 family protein [Pseudooceanicola algae]|uniref:DUF4440 domain-containing protein n=1 Tax=Pseudooceanicola algae TaxID=1537215 RepID=A0A418SI26_9RHOB|nr:nuclear transport factor 2 family protein [Pseudooceanicola algae]QPM92128.1 hypothetical protein PSAL_033910 [Pseudooceanicola algae]